MKIQFIGIGGIGISALAKWALHLGHDISGINDSESPQTLDELRQKGVKIEIGTAPELLDETAELYVYSSAWRQRAPELMDKAQSTGKARSYFAALGDFARGKKVIAVSGTHGKTTTTSMLHKILKEHDFAHNTIVGSKLAEEGSNFVPADSDTDWLLVEACEYKRHFLNFYPQVLVITNIDEDHLDYYKDLEDIKSAFRELGSQIQEGGTLVANLKDRVVSEVYDDLQREKIDWSSFEDDLPKLYVPGEHNRQNAAAAMAAAASVLDTDFDAQKSKDALQDFKGTWRRFETIKVTDNGVRIVSDYAHHPREIKATLSAAREIVGEDGKLIAIFEPHTYTRFSKLSEDFAEAFQDADELFVLPVYAAREKKIPEINEKFIVEKINKVSKNARALKSTKEALHDALAQDLPSASLIVLLSAGVAHDELQQIINKNV